jgi:plasmid stabilization system protein ParE
MGFVLAPEALKDLTDIYEFIAQDNPAAADRVLDRLYESFQLLADGDVKGPGVRLIDGRHVQYWPVRPYKIYYLRTAD